MSYHQREQYYCSSCKLPYDTVAQYEEHLWSMLHHRVLENNGQKENHHCILCLETFRTLTDYSVHLISDKHKDAHSRWQRVQSGPSSKKSFRSNWSEHTGTVGPGRSTSYHRSYSYSHYSYKDRYRKKPYSKNRAYHGNAPSRNAPSLSYETGLFGEAKRGNSSNRLDRFSGNGSSYSGHNPEWTEGEWTRMLQICEKQTGRRFETPYSNYYSRPSLEMSYSGKSTLNTMNGEQFNKSEHLSMDAQNQSTGRSCYDAEGNHSARSHTPPERPAECFSEDVTFSQTERRNDVPHFPPKMQHAVNFVNGNERVQRPACENFDKYYGCSNSTEQEVEHGRSSVCNDQWQQESMDYEEIVKNDSRPVTRKESEVRHGSIIVHVEVNKGFSDCSTHSRQTNSKEVPKPVGKNVCRANEQDESDQRCGGDGSEERNEGEQPKTDIEDIVNKSEEGVTKNVAESSVIDKMYGKVADKPRTLEAKTVEVLSNLDMLDKEGSIPFGRLELPSASRSVETVHLNPQTKTESSVLDLSHTSYGNEMSTSDSFEVTNGSPKQLCETQLHNHSNAMLVSSVTKSNARDPEQPCESKLDNCNDVMSSTSLTQSIVSPNGGDKISDGKQTPEVVATQNNQMSIACTSASPDTMPSFIAPNDKVSTPSITFSSGPPGAGQTQNVQMSTSSSSDTIPPSRAPNDKVPPASSTVSSWPISITSGAGTTQNSQMSTTCTSAPSWIMPSSSSPNDKVQPALKTISSGPTNTTSGAGTCAPSGTFLLTSASINIIPPASSTISSGSSNKTLSSVTSTSQLKLPDLIQKLLKKQSSKPNLNSARLSHPRESSGVATGDLKRVLVGLFEIPVPQHHRKLQEEQLRKLFAKVGSSSDRFKKFGVHLEMADTEEDEMIKVLEKLTEEDLELLSQNESHDILHELLSLYEVPGEIPHDQSLQIVTPSSITLSSVASSFVTPFSMMSSSVTSSSMMSSSVTSSSLMSSSMMSSSVTPSSVTSSYVTSSSLVPQYEESNSQPAQLCTEQTTSEKPGEVVHYREELLVSSESEEDDVEVLPQSAEIDQAVYGQVFQLSCEENQLRELLKSSRKELRALENKIREYTEKAKALKAKRVETKKKMKSVRKNRLKLTTDHVKQSTQGMPQIPLGKDSTTKPSSQKNQTFPLPGPKPIDAVSATTTKESCHPNTLPRAPVPQLPVIKPGSQRSFSGTSSNQTFPHQYSPAHISSTSAPSTSGLNVCEPSPLPGVGPNYGVGQINIPPEAMGISIQRISEEEVMKLVQMQGVAQSISCRETATGEKGLDTSQQRVTEGRDVCVRGENHQESSINAQQGPLLPDRSSQAFGFISHGTPHSTSEIIPSELQEGRSQPQFTGTQQHVADPRLSNNTNPELFHQVQVTTSDELENRSSGNSVSLRPSESESSYFPPYPVGIIKVNHNQQSSVDRPLENMQNGHTQMEALSRDKLKQSHKKNLKTVVIKKEPESGNENFIADQNCSDKQKMPGRSEPQGSVPSCSVIKVVPVDPSESAAQQEVQTNHGHMLRPRKVAARSKNLTLTEDTERLKESNENSRPKRLRTSVTSNSNDCSLQLKKVSVRCKDVTLETGMGRLKESDENSQPSSSKRSLTSATSKRGSPSQTSSSKKDDSRKERTPKEDGSTSDTIQDLKELKKKLKLEKKNRIALKRHAKFLKRLDDYRKLGLSKKFMDIAGKRSQAKLQDRRDLNAEVRRLQKDKNDRESMTLRNSANTKPTTEGMVDKNTPLSGESDYLKALFCNHIDANRVKKQKSKASKKAKRMAQLRSVGIPEELLDIVKKGSHATKAEAAWLNKEMSKKYQKELSSLKSKKKGRNPQTNTSQNQIKQNSMDGNQKMKMGSRLDLEDPSSSGVVTRRKSRACNNGSTTTVNETLQKETSGEGSLRSKRKRNLQQELCQEKAILGLHGCFEKLYTVSVDGATRSLSLPDLQQQRVYAGHQKRITGFHVYTDPSRNLNMLFTSSQDQKLLCFNLENNQLLHTETFRQPITCMVGIGESLFLGLVSGRVELFHAQKLLSYESYVCHNKEITCLAVVFITGSQYFLSGATDGTLAIHSVSSGILFGALRGHRSSVLCAQVTGDYVLSGASDGCLLQHSITTKQVIKEYSCHQAAITNILVQGNVFYTASLDDTVRVFNWKKRQIISRISVDKVLSLCSYEQKIYVGTADGIVVPLPKRS